MKKAKCSTSSDLKTKEGFFVYFLYFPYGTEKLKQTSKRL